MHFSEPLLKCSDGFDLVVEHQPQKKSSDQVAADVSYSFDFSTKSNHPPMMEQTNIPKEEGIQKTRRQSSRIWRRRRDNHL